MNSVVVESDSAAGHIKLVLSFDNEISQAEAGKIRTALTDTARKPDISPAALNGAPMWCGSHISDGDTNCDFDIQYSCGPNVRTLPWGFRISAAVRAIIVGNVNESGLRWWRNGYPQPQNAPHVVPPDYTFHGTMQPVWATGKVSYQDYMTFRHNLGSGGTGSLTFAGLVELKN